MITKSEVLESIARCQSLTGSGPLDMTPVRVSKGDLAVLVEAAKAAKFRNISRAFDNAQFVLDDGTAIISGQ